MRTPTYLHDKVDIYEMYRNFHSLHVYVCVYTYVYIYNYIYIHMRSHLANLYELQVGFHPTAIILDLDLPTLRLVTISQ